MFAKQKNGCGFIYAMRWCQESPAKLTYGEDWWWRRGLMTSICIPAPPPPFFLRRRWIRFYLGAYYHCFFRRTTHGDDSKVTVCFNLDDFSVSIPFFQCCKCAIWENKYCLPKVRRLCPSSIHLIDGGEKESPSTGIIPPHSNYWRWM